MSAADAVKSFHALDRAKLHTIAYALYSADGSRSLHFDDPRKWVYGLQSTDLVKELIYKE